jgi:hypothetical protein
VVVDDPGPDGVEIAGLVFAILAFVVGSVASAVSIYLSWRAVKIGRQANDAAVKAAEEAERANEEASRARAAVAAERRRTFELEVFRDLLDAVDGQWQLVRQIADSPTALSRFSGKFHLVPGDLQTWHRVWQAEPPDRFGVAAVLGVGDENVTEPGKSAASVEVVSRLHKSLVQDVLDAINRRMDARDL